MNENYKKLVRLLRELFQIDQADLDFGIYRIMNQKSDEINDFLENDLIPQVEEAFLEHQSGDRKHIEAEIEKVVEQAKGLGADPETLPKYKELKAKLSDTTDVKELENEVFSRLYDFFRRYYNEGDFLSLRRYKAGVYAIPYEGEEVKLHWANADQYYIKSSEYLRDYSFKLPDGKSVHFKLVEAGGEVGNKKAEQGKERRFVLAEEEPLAIEDGELFIRFEYRPDAEKRKQEKINEATLDAVLSSKGFEDWIARLSILAPTEKNPKRTILEKHLAGYTARFTFDYFIHKDLGGFLRRELDFYIKNEVMFLDDIENETAPKVEQFLSKIKAIRKIAHKLIKFLEQLENFQKKLWLKKKFVVETNYCVTLDRVPEELYPEIIRNKEQIEEWKRLFAIDEIKGDLVTKAYSEPLTIDFLKANPYLLLDTKFFNEEFRNVLLSSKDNVDEQCDGLLINGDNFQALELLSSTFGNTLKTTYIDPPYNTHASEILYKNDYKHSSWLCLIESRIKAARTLLGDDGIICVTIDDFEFHNLKAMLSKVFESSNYLGTASIRNNPQGRSTVKGFSINHEYALFYANGAAVKSVGRLKHTKEQIERYNEIDSNGKRFLWENFRKTGTDSHRSDRPKQYYPIYYDGSIIRIPKMEWVEVKKKWDNIEEPKKNEEAFWPIDENGTERVWKWGHERVIDNPSHIKVSEGNGNEKQVYRRNYLNVEGPLPPTWWDKAKYAAGSHGTNLLTDIFGSSHTFPFPKSIYAVEDCLRVAGVTGSTEILDFFGGSGTTGHAVINLNREDEGNRKYILVEMGDYFDTVLKPRIQKIVYSKDWKDGKPVSREGISQMFKYIRLESYEDTLNNLELTRTKAQQDLLKSNKNLKEEYMLSYMLDIESKGSASLLNIDSFEDPFSYKLKVATSDVGESKPVNVDLVETFNYLLGLVVQKISVVDGFKVIEGNLRTGEKTLVIWRKIKEKDNDALDSFFSNQDYGSKEKGFERIYINGDNNLANLKTDSSKWRVFLTEEEFKRLMFDVSDV